ncbi:unnamed protein product [Rotaria sordida]|uniref:Uncharacterized protein n=1 Tax=Rotaria sordida TaxID=392033 RepID=A0A818JE34_9BILA|nr:unnamed protein product [Rotaria sordida]CAF3538896.1 unnamed protein product [Rotaria sordida]
MFEAAANTRRGSQAASAHERRETVPNIRSPSFSTENSSQRTMSTTEVDLESVLQVRRRGLSNAGFSTSQDSYRYTDIIILKVEKSNDILKEDARCVFHGDYHVLTDIFQKYTSHIKIHHNDPEMIKNHDRLSGKLHITIELPTMSLIEVLEILHKHYFSIVASSTNFASTTKLQEFILLRNKDIQDNIRSLPIIDTKTS